MTSSESFDVVLRRAPEVGGATVLEDVLGLSADEAQQAVKKLPAAVIRGTTRAHGEIASGLFREAGWVVELVVHGAPLDAPTAARSKRRAPREISEAQGRHRDLSTPLTARRLVPVKTSVGAEAAMAGAAALELPPQAPVVPEVAQVEPLPEPAVEKQPAEAVETPSAEPLFAPLVAVPSPEPRAATALPERADDHDSAFGPLDFESGLFTKSAVLHEPPKRVTADDAIEALFQAPSPALAAQGLAAVEREARARLENDEGPPGFAAAAAASAPRAPGKKKRVQGNVVLPDIAPESKNPWFKRSALALLALSIAYLGAAWYKDSEATARIIAAHAKAGTSPTAEEISGIHPAIRLAPHGIQQPMGMILRRLVDGLFPVSIDNDGMPADTQCLLVKGGDGKLEKRLERLKRTGVTLRLDAARSQEMQEHIESLRAALNEPELVLEPLCLSVAQYQELTTPPSDAP